jgi:hypothetical protein
VIDPEMQAAYAGLEKSLRAEVAGEPGPVERAEALLKARGYRQKAARMVSAADAEAPGKRASAAGVRY